MSISGIRANAKTVRLFARTSALGAAPARGPAAFRLGDDLLDPIEIFPCNQAEGAGGGARGIAKQIDDIYAELGGDRGKDIHRRIDLTGLDLRNVPSGVAGPFGEFFLTPAARRP